MWAFERGGGCIGVFPESAVYIYIYMWAFERGGGVYWCFPGVGGGPKPIPGYGCQFALALCTFLKSAWKGLFSAI